MKQILAQIKIRTSLIVLIVICVLCAAGWGQSSMSHLGNAASIDGLLPLSTDCLLVVGSIDPGGDSFVVTACGKSYSIRNVGQLGNFSRIMPTGNNTGWVILDGRLRKANFSRNGVSLDEAVAVGRSFWRDVFFLNARQGWACGSDGKIIGSRDGGRTWRSLVSTTDIDLMQVRFADKRLGWAIGREYRNGSFLSVFLTTSDGGEHWQKIDKDLVTASFVRGLRGCGLIDTRAALCTRDGKQWSSVPIENSNATDILFRNELAGYVVGDTISKTDDGGSTWRDVLEKDQRRQFSTLTNIVFTSDTIGYAWSSGAVLRTKDAGRTWRNISRQWFGEGLTVE